MSARKNLLAPLDVCQRYTIPEAIDYLRSSRASVYKDIRSGKIRIIKDEARRRTYVPGSEIARLSRAPEAHAA